MSGSQEHSTAEVIRAALVQLVLGTNPAANAAWPIYASGEPSSPDNCLTVYDTAGSTEGRHHVDGMVQEHPGIQVRIRSSGYRVGWTKANSVSIALDQINYASVVIGTKTYEVYSVTRSGNIIYVGNESSTSKRQIFTVNAVVALRQIG